jgi:hypothetical protein
MPEHALSTWMRNRGPFGQLRSCPYTRASGHRYIVYAGYMDTELAIIALGALAQGTRLDVFRLLVRHEPEGMAAGAIARQLDVPQNTMSAHLGILARAGTSWSI